MYNKITRIAPVALSTAEITQNLKKSTLWRLENNALSRDFVLRDFESTWGFLTQVSMRSHIWGHHPTITTTYNKVKIELTTHDVGGISNIDFKLAKKIDGFAELYSNRTQG